MKEGVYLAFLYDYQFDAVQRMKDGCILNGGVGSGKSRTGLYYYFKEMGGSIDPDYIPMKKPLDLYIITTAMKRDKKEWEKELLPYLMYTKPDTEYPETDLYQHKIVIDSWNNIKKYVDVENAFFIFDEDKVTGYGSWVKSFLKITKKNRWILLSATAGDSWIEYLPVFIANGFYKNKTQFEMEHVIYDHHVKFPKINRYVGTKKLMRFRNQVLIPMEDQRETIEHHEDVFVSYDISLYKETMKNRWDPYKNEPVTDAAALCYLLRKIVNSDISRQIKLLEIFEEHPKLIIFYNFDYELEIIKNLEFGGVQIAEWNGHRHDPVPTGDSWVYLVNYMAGAEGWNCTTTDTMVFYSQSYSYKTTIQAAGRINRMNTPFKDLYYYHLKSKSTIDISITRALARKENFNAGKFITW